MRISGTRILLSGIFLAAAMSGRADAACGEASCVAAQGSYISHFTGANCNGTESYYLPYDSYGYQCRPAQSGGASCGTSSHTVTNRSYYYNGHCYNNAWPSGNTLNEFVTVYRNQPPVACGYLSSYSGTAPLDIIANASCSYDLDGYVVGYEWQYGDGFGYSTYDFHTYFYPGYYGVYLTVWDNEGAANGTYLGNISVY
jgi:hypothetical protein